uniref:Uncharacterized protein n=1 Tax=Caenorhabditis japonica TaxID=281687 RepID=A0A8R1E332_CAEJA
MSSPRNHFIRSRPKLAPLSCHETPQREFSGLKYEPYSPPTLIEARKSAERGACRNKKTLGYTNYRHVQNFSSAPVNIGTENFPAYTSRLLNNDQVIQHQSDEPFETSVPTVPSLCSSDNRWSALGFASQKMYDLQIGIPLNRIKIEV